MPEDADQFHAPVKELAEYARSRGFRVILRTSPKTKGFFSVGAWMRDALETNNVAVKANLSFNDQDISSFFGLAAMAGSR